MYMSDHDKDIISNQIGRLGGTACTLLAELAGDETSLPDTYCAGYLQGYIHAIDAACNIIYHAAEV